MNFANLAAEHTPLQKRLKIETRSPPPTIHYSGMCPTTSTASIPLPPPLTFNSTKFKPKSNVMVSTANGIPSVVPFSPAVQSCQVPAQPPRHREPIVCKHSTEMLTKLNAISKDLITLSSLVKDVQKQQSQLHHQLSQTQERVSQNADLIRTISEQFKTQMTTLLQGQVEQTEFIRATSLKYDEQMRVCKEDVSYCKNMCSEIMKQNDGFTDTLQSIREAVVQTAQNTNSAALEAAASSVPHLSHEPLQAAPLAPNHDNILPSLQSQIQAQATNDQQQSAGPQQQIQIANPGYSTNTPHKNSAPQQQQSPQVIQLADNKYYCIGPNGVQQQLQMFSVSPQILQGIQAIQNIQGGNNLVQIVSPGQVKSKSNRPTEIRPKTATTPKKSENGNMYSNSSCGASTHHSPKTTNILEEASKVFSNPTLESEGESSYNLYSQSEKDALSEAIMTIPTTYAQHGSHSHFSESLVEGRGEEEGSMQLTSEMLSKAINVVEGDHNLYFDKVLLNPAGSPQAPPKPDLTIPRFLPDEVINCVFRKSKEPSIYALNICREIISREEFINNDFKSFVGKNPLKYKFIENLLMTKFGLYSDHLQSILKDVRIKFNNYHRHVKRSVRLKEIHKQEQLQLELERLEQQQQREQSGQRELEQQQRAHLQHEGTKMLELLKQEPSVDEGSFKLISPGPAATSSFVTENS